MNEKGDTEDLCESLSESPCSSKNSSSMEMFDGGESGGGNSHQKALLDNDLLHFLLSLIDSLLRTLTVVGENEDPSAEQALIVGLADRDPIPRTSARSETETSAEQNPLSPVITNEKTVS